MKPIFNRYTLEEIRKIINNEETVKIISNFTIPKSDENQKIFYSVVSYTDGHLHEAIQCGFGGEDSFEHYVGIEFQSGPERFDIFLERLEKNRQEGKISNEEYEQTKKEIQTLRLQILF